MNNITEIDRASLAELISRIEYAIENNLALSVEDMKLLLLAITTLCSLQSKIEQNDVTLHKLRKLLGIVQQSESRKPIKDLDNNTNNSSNKNRSSKKKSRTPKTPLLPPDTLHHKIQVYSKGQECPYCNHGKLYKFTPANLLRVTGHARFEVKQHIVEQLRCNGCQKVYSADLPESVLEDGAANQKYGYSARALMAIDKFYSGIPYYHQSNLADIFGHAISASTIYDQCEHVANAVMPVFYELQRQAADAKSFLIDDTHNRILNQEPEMRDRPNGKGKQMRNGVYTSGLIAICADMKKIILFDTSLGHAGEHLDNILKKRSANLDPPLVMCDALSSNTITKKEIRISHCNAHARRQFYDLEAIYPKDVGWLLDKYAIIWKNETAVRDKNLNDQQRLDYHKQHSLSVMQQIHTWAAQKTELVAFEENSSLGKAIKYYLKHYDRLIMFCIEAGAFIDNNIMEEKLKIIIRGRKTAHFYKTAIGADVANVLASLMATADQDGANVYDYLLALQKNPEKIKANPENWLPWNYQNNLKVPDAKRDPEKDT
jgi:transposase